MTTAKGIIAWASLAIFLVVVFLLVSFGREVARNLAVQREIDAFKARNQELQTSNSELSDLITDLSDPYYVEGEGRVKQNLKKPGETVFVIENSSLASSSSVSNETQAPTLSNPKKWFLLFFSPQDLAQSAEKTL